MTIDFGLDLSCVSDLEEEGRVVTGALLLGQALVRRWMTPRGMLLGSPDYGTDLREFLNEDVDELTLIRIKSEARAEALKDERVIDVTFNAATYDLTTGRLFLEMAVEATEGTLTLKVAITDVTVELLEAA